MTVDSEALLAASRERAGEAAVALVADALVWDMTLPWLPGWNDTTTLPRFRAAGFDLVSLTVNDFPGSIAGTVAHVARMRRAIEHDPDMVLIRTADDVLQARAAGRLALTFNLQETNPLERSVEMVETYYALGVRHMLLAYNQKNDVGDGCAERTDAGLSRFGIEVIREMNRVGMMVDGTHCGHRTSMEAIEVCEGPFVFTHCCAAAIHPHYRNLRDDQIKACAATGGVIGVNGVGLFLFDMEGRPESMFRHIDHMTSLVGPAHVGLALDYLADPARFFAGVRANPAQWPPIDGKPHPEAAFVQPEQLVELVGLMLARGYAESDVRGILGENFLRVARQVWR